MRLTPLLVLPLLLAPLAACGDDAKGTADKPTVVAAAYPFEWLAEQIAGDSADVVGLVKPGVEPHDLELTPRQVATIRSARAVFYLKGFQPAVDDAVKGLPQAYDLSKAVAQVSGEGGELDPHVWLDPVLMKALAGDVASVLEEKVASGDASGIQAARDRVDASLTSLDATFRSSLQGCRSKDLVTSHAAFGYLATRYGLVQRGISGLSPESEPSPKKLAEVAEFARKNHVSTIFFESLVSPKLAQTVAAEVGAKTAVLDPIEGVEGSDDYLSVQRRNAATLHTALGCR